MGPPGFSLFVIFLLFIQGKNFLHQNDVEFDLSIGHALVLFPFFVLIINKKCTVDHVRPPYPLPIPPQNSYISIYFGHKTLFSPNLMIIIMGTCRNTSNYMKWPNFTLVHQLIIRCYHLYESFESLCGWRMNFKCMPRA